jgi:small-conductance mechanosensitive channel
MAEDSYTPAQASLALGLSVKRVRQLVTEGKLKPVTDKPLTLSQREVHALRKQRKEKGVTPYRPRGKQGQDSQVDSQALIVALGRLEELARENQRLKAIEDGARRNEETLREQVALLESALADAQRPWYRRKKRG